MFSVFGIILISLNLVIGSSTVGNGYYWREYNGTTPTDAIVDLDTDLAIVQISSKKYDGIHPTGVKRSGASEIKYEIESITEDIKVLCSENPEKYYWEWATAATVRSRNRGEVLVNGGHDNYGYVLIAKIFTKDRWYLGEIDGDFCFFYDVDGCSQVVTSTNWCRTPDCMVLKYK